MYEPDKPRMMELTAVEPRGPDRLSADRPSLLRLGEAEQSWVAAASEAVDRAAIFVPAPQTAEKA